MKKNWMDSNRFQIGEQTLHDGSRNMQRFIFQALILVLTFGIHVMSLNAAPLGPADAGPENGGLRLKLIIENHADKPDDARTIHLLVIHVGEKPVTLVGQWEYEQPPGEYSAWLRRATEFTTFPEVVSDMAGTSGEERVSPQPTHVLKPGETLAVKWREWGPTLKSPEDNLEDHLNTAPTLPSVGMYSVRAHFTALTAEGKRLLLSSNEQPVVIGGKLTMPKFATTRVLDADAVAKSAEIRLGSDQGIQPGDVFQLTNPEMKGVAWWLTISHSATWWSEGSVLRDPGDPADDEPFPQTGWQATLAPPH
jgi:hypothetical protein